MKEKYKVLVDNYFNKEEMKTYPKNSIIELAREKADYLLKEKAIVKINDKKDNNGKEQEKKING